MTAADFAQLQRERTVARLVPCPVCAAAPNEPCRTWHGPTRFPHTARTIVTDPLYRRLLDEAVTG